MKEIYLAGGCFWGMQAYFEQLQGIVATEVGYANGHVENPTYEMVCIILRTDEIGHLLGKYACFLVKGSGIHYTVNIRITAECLQ